MATSDRFERPDDSALPEQAHSLSAPVALFFIITALLVALHAVLLSTITSSIDDVKYLTLWLGGPVCLMIHVMLSSLRLVRRPPRWLLIGWALYLIACIASTQFAAADHATWIGWKAVRTTICAFGFFVAAAAICQTQRTSRMALVFWTALAALTTLPGLFHYLGGMNWLEAAMARGYERQRLAGNPAEYSGFFSLVSSFAATREMMSTILNRQFYGVFLGFALPVSLGLVVLSLAKGREDGYALQCPRMTLFSAASAALIALCMILTFSKTSFLILGFGPLFLISGLAAAREPVLRIPAWPVAAALSAILLGTALWLARADIAIQVGALSTSLGSRGILWDAALKMFRSNPLLGTGPSSYVLEFPAWRSPDYHMHAISNVTLSAHNWVLDQLAETGLAGTLPWLFVNLGTVGIGLHAGIKSPRREMRIICLSFTAGLIALLAGNLLTSMFRWPIGVVTQAVALGATAGAAVTALKGDYDEAPQSLQFGPRVVVTGILVAAAFAFLVFQGRYAVRFLKAAEATQKGLEAAFLPPSFEQSADNPQALDFAEDHLRLSVDLFEEALAYDPTYMTTYYKLAHSWNRIGGINRLRYTALAAKPDRVSEEASIAGESLYESLGNQENAFAAYDRLAAYAPDYAEIHFNRAVLHMTVARDCLEALDAFPMEEASHARLLSEARRHYRLGEKAAERAMQLSNKISVHYLSGDLYANAAAAWPEGTEDRRDQYRRAGEIFAVTRDLPLTTALQSPNQTQIERDERFKAGVRASETFYKAEEWELAAAEFEGLLTRFPASINLYKRAVDCHMRSERPEEALRVLDGGLRLNPIHPSLRLLRAEVLLNSAEVPDHNRDVLREVETLREIDQRIPDFLSEEDRQQCEELSYLAERALLTPTDSSPKALETPALSP